MKACACKPISKQHLSHPLEINRTTKRKEHGPPSQACSRQSVTGPQLFAQGLIINGSEGAWEYKQCEVPNLTTSRGRAQLALGWTAELDGSSTPNRDQNALNNSNEPRDYCFSKLGLVIEAGNSLYSTTQDPRQEDHKLEAQTVAVHVLAWHAPSPGSHGSPNTPQDCTN